MCRCDGEQVTELSETARGSGGFGSTGVKREAQVASTNGVRDHSKRIKVRHAFRDRPTIGNALGT